MLIVVTYSRQSDFFSLPLKDIKAFSDELAYAFSLSLAALTIQSLCSFSSGASTSSTQVGTVSTLVL